MAGNIDRSKWVELPTIITHSVVAACAVRSFNTGTNKAKFWILSLVCAGIPDMDVIGYRWLYIPSYEFFGHRGFFHSPFFAALLGILIAAVFYRKEGFLSIQWSKYVLYFFALTASHGLLDALTNGGNGIALLSPFTSERYFFPWTPIEVSPLSIRGFLSHRGLAILKSEVVWVWGPCLLLLIFLKTRRKIVTTAVSQCGTDPSNSARQS